VAEDLRALLNGPVVLANDVNCGGLGEATYGAAKGGGSAAAAFVGTGLGGAIILAGKVINGAHGFAGEIGHVPAPFDGAPCSCGRIGCLETVASKTGIARMILANQASGMRCRIKIDKDQAALLRSAACLAGGMSIDAPGDQGLGPRPGLGAGGDGRDLRSRGLRPGRRRDRGDGKCVPAPGARPAAIYSLLYSRRPDVRLAALGDDAVAIGAAVASQEVLR
jgi:hypothetical protein